MNQWLRMSHRIRGHSITGANKLRKDNMGNLSQSLDELMQIDGATAAAALAAAVAAAQ